MAAGGAAGAADKGVGASGGAAPQEKASDTSGAGTKPAPGSSEKAGVADASASGGSAPAASEGGASASAGSAVAAAPGEAAKADGAADAGGGDEPPQADEVGKRFSVQVGAFLVEKNARNLVEDLEGWGYPAFVFEAKDAKGRVWYAVRFGDYEDKKQATQAASEFMKKAKKAAVVSVQDAL